MLPFSMRTLHFVPKFAAERFFVLTILHTSVYSNISVCDRFVNDIPTEREEMKIKLTNRKKASRIGVVY